MNIRLALTGTLLAATPIALSVHAVAATDNDPGSCTTTEPTAQLEDTAPPTPQCPDESEMPTETPTSDPETPTETPTVQPSHPIVGDGACLDRPIVGGPCGGTPNEPTQIESSCSANSCTKTYSDGTTKTVRYPADRKDEGL